jgi:hypothetical protein
MNAIKNTRKFCTCCQHSTKFESNTMVWGFGDLVMLVLTAGAWLVIRGIWDLVGNPWRCATCGTSETFKGPRLAKLAFALSVLGIFVYAFAR